jgi:predicted MFS family arabinose efflux permease
MITKTINLYKNAYGGISKSIWLLALAMFINRCGTMVLPYLSLYLTQYLHYSLAKAGIVLSIYGMGALVGTYLGGILTDKIGHYKVQVFSLFWAGCMLLMLMFLKNYYSICVGVFVFTCLGDTFRPANSAAIAAYSNTSDRTRAFTINRLAVNLGWAIGAGFGGFLAFYNYKLLFIVDGTTCILASIFLYFYLKPGQQTFEVEKATISDISNKISPYKDKLFLFFVFLVVLFAVSFFMLFSILPVYLKQIHHLTEIQIGGLETMNGLLIVALEMFIVVELQKRFSKAYVIAFGVFLVGISFISFNIFTFAGIAILVFLLNTFGEMFAMPFMQTFSVERSGVSNRGQYTALYSMCYSFAQIASPALGAWVTNSFGYPILWNIVFLLCMTSATGFVWLGKRI